VLDRLVRPNNPKANVLNCGMGALPSFGPWCRTRPFEPFTYDPDRARRILEGGGYDCSSPICVKGGQPLEVEYYALGVRERAVETQSIVVEQVRKAGLALIERTYENSPNPSPWLYPIVDTMIGMYGDPGVTETLSCDQIPSEEKFGHNWTHWCNPEADRLMHESDREVDPQRRLALMERIYQLEAHDFVSLPLYVLPVITAWRTDKIAGPIGKYSSTPYGMFFNMNEWYVPGPPQT
jgi:ABC-type transport system substrate-binding protein